MATKRERDARNARKTDAKSWAKGQEKGTFDATSVKLPEGLSFFKLDRVGTYKVDFMPFVTGKNNPAADEGFVHFERTYEAHRIPTANGKRMYVCRAACFKKKCAVCSWLLKNGGNADQELVKSLRSSKRHLWLVNDKPGDPKNPLKVFDTNHFNRGMGFGELMADAINSVEDYANFAELEGGYTLQLTVKEQTFPGGKFNAVTRIDFIPRKYKYPESVLDKAPCLDDMLIDPGFNEVLELLESGGGESSSSDEDEPKKKPQENQAEAAGIVVGSAVEHTEHGKCVVVHVSGDGTSLRLEDEDGTIYRGIDPDDCKVLEDDEPAPKKKPAKKPEPEDDDDDDDEPAPKKKPAKKPEPEDDDDDDDEPAPKKKPAKKPEPEDDDDDDDDEPAPKKKPAKKPEPEDDDDDDDDDEPAPKKKKPAKKPEPEDDEDEDDDEEIPF